jgi:hypothetical protein
MASDAAREDRHNGQHYNIAPNPGGADRDQDASAINGQSARIWVAGLTLATQPSCSKKQKAECSTVECECHGKQLCTCHAHVDMLTGGGIAPPTFRTLDEA